MPVVNAVNAVKQVDVMHEVNTMHAVDAACPTERVNTMHVVNAAHHANDGDARGREVNAIVVECIQASCRAAFARAKDSHGDLSGTVKLQALAGSTCQIMESELATYSNPLRRVCPRAAVVACRQLHECFGEVYLPSLRKLEGLDVDTIGMCKAADGLEKAIVDRCGAGLKDLELWGTNDVIRPHLFKWVDQQMQVVHCWRKRLIEAEDWKPLSTSNTVSRSAVEFMKILMDSVRALFALDLPIPRQVILTLMNNIDQALQGYGLDVVHGIGPAKDLIPPLPPLTRFKKRSSTGTAQGDEVPVKRGMGVTRRVKKLKAYLKEQLLEPAVPSIGAEPNYKFVSGLTVNSLVVRVNSLQFIRDSLPELESLLQSSWLRSAKPAPADNASWITGALQTAQTELTESTQSTCEFL
ncbi:unnamed protein product, partial [Ostreobium quekettii]|eukprot:evm.model.scf_2209.1 EVM.evm.TU.scf_2209.1   scf_2209:16276-21091(+)